MLFSNIYLKKWQKPYSPTGLKSRLNTIRKSIKDLGFLNTDPDPGELKLAPKKLITLRNFALLFIYFIYNRLHALI